MMKKILAAFAALLCSLSVFAQTGELGGVKGTVVNRAGRVPITNAHITIVKDAVAVVDDFSRADGSFIFEGLEDGNYLMTVSAEGFISSRINLTVEGYVKDLIFVSLVAEQRVAEVDDSNFAEFDMEDSGYTDAPAILFGANDPYNKIVGYGFSDVRFKNRGYANETQDVLLAGVRMNDAVTGYSPFSLWSGLNEAMRAKESTIGTETSDYSLGGYNGVTNILANPASVRPGWRFSLLSNSALYRLRLMANYASGELDNGWSFAANVSARLGGNDWVKGVYYRSFAYYFGAEKKFNDEHRLAFMAFATPGSRGAQNASTQEVYDMMKKNGEFSYNMYNSNWGYQNGKVRNSRVRSTHEPVFILKYTANPLENLEAGVTLLYRTGKNGYSALDWYDSADPRPDYYRNLPSYFYMEDSNWRRYNMDKYEFAREAWRTDVNTQHLDWDRLYNINYNAADGRSKYVQEERRVDQHDFNLAANVKWSANSWFTLNGGLNAKINRSEYYKKIKDLLGGEYYLNTDNFAERDFAFSDAMIQNDLDYWIANGSAKQIGKGGRYGYDYYAQVRNGNLWADGRFDLGNFKANVGAKLGFSSFWREGLVRKGLFAGLDTEQSLPTAWDGGSNAIRNEFNEIIVKDINGNPLKLTTYDPITEEVITSKGKSKVSTFLTYSVKAHAEYVLTGGHRFFANVGFFNDAPTFNQSFLSPRTRNSLIPNLTTTKTVSADINYQLSNNGYDLRLTGFVTQIMDQSVMKSFYDDSQHSFTNFAMTGIDQRHLGLELGFKLPLGVQGLNLQGALSWGQYIYTSTPTMYQTVDNSSEIVADSYGKPITYWASSPVYKVRADAEIPANSTIIPNDCFEIDEDGNYVVEKIQKHHVPSTPQLAANLALNYRTRSYWFFTLGANVYANSYLDMNPLYRTIKAAAGPNNKLYDDMVAEHAKSWILNSEYTDAGLTPGEINYMTAQEKFKPAVVMNLSVGKSWYIRRTYNFGFSLEAKNLLNNRDIRTGGYEQTRLIKSADYKNYYKFDSKYFYMQGVNYMLNLYFRF